MTGHLAVDADGESYQAAGFDYARHDQWVRKGFCAVVSGSRAYCGKQPGHSGRHGSAVQVNPDHDDVTWLEWDH